MSHPAHLPDTPERVGLVADDFTGAADSASVFAEHGWKVRLLVDAAGSAADMPAGTVLARATGTRALEDEPAARLTSAAVARMIDDGADRLFLKIDSTIRGSVRAQVTSALAAWSRVAPGARALVCPAFPAQGRTVRGGVVLVDGTPVAETASGRDPVTPIPTSDLTAVFPDYATNPDAVAARSAGFVADATTDEDLDRLADLAADDPDLVCVGSAGLASALARVWSRSPPSRRGALRGGGSILIAVSSLHPVTVEQVRQVRMLAAADVEILTTPVQRDLDPVEAAQMLARAVRTAVQGGTVQALIIVGGDGAAAILTELEAVAVDIDGVLDTGCPVGTVAGGYADGLRIATKSGGFGGPATLIDLIRALSPTP